MKARNSFELNINMDNAPIAHGNGGSEIARILRGIAALVEYSAGPDQGLETWRLRDANGNSVGRAQWESEDQHEEEEDDDV